MRFLLATRTKGIVNYDLDFDKDISEIPFGELKLCFENQYGFIREGKEYYGDE